MMNYDKFLSRAGRLMQESAIRRMGTIVAHKRDIISFAPGYPAPETFPWQEFQEIARELLTGTRRRRSFSTGRRADSVRCSDAIVGMMETPRHRDGLRATARDHRIAAGARPRRARAARSGRRRARRASDLHRARSRRSATCRPRWSACGRTADGIDLDDLDACTCPADTATAVASASSMSFRIFRIRPGLLIGLDKRRLLLEWAARRDLLIVEDDPYRELFFEDSATESDVRPIRADDEDGRVIYLSSFSKTLAPGYRVAWIDAPAPLAAKLEMAKQAADLLTGEPRPANRVRSVRGAASWRASFHCCGGTISRSATQWSRPWDARSATRHRGRRREAASFCG